MAENTTEDLSEEDPTEDKESDVKEFFGDIFGTMS
jgi:hypothetical protein